MTKNNTPVRDNAILKFGMRMTMKKNGSCVLLCIVSCITMLIFSITAGVMNLSSADSTDFATAGQVLLAVLSSLHFALCIFLAPAVAGSAITSEREKQTLDVMLCSQMSPRDIVMGKFLSSISWIVLVSISLLPSYAIIYIFGGVPVYAIIFVMLYIIWATAVCASIAVMMSSLLRRTSGAIILSFIIIFGIETVNLMLTGLYYGIFGMLENMWYQYRYSANVVYRAFGNTYSTPFGWYNEIVSPVLWFNPVLGFAVVLIWSGFGSNVFMNLGFSASHVIFAMIATIVCNVAVYSLLAVLALKAARKAVDPMRPDRYERKRLKKQRRTAKARLRTEAKTGAQAAEGR